MSCADANQSASHYTSDSYQQNDYYFVIYDNARVKSTYGLSVIFRWYK